MANNESKPAAPPVENKASRPSYMTKEEIDEARIALDTVLIDIVNKVADRWGLPKDGDVRSIRGMRNRVAVANEVSSKAYWWIAPSRSRDDERVGRALYKSDPDTYHELLTQGPKKKAKGSKKKKGKKPAREEASAKQESSTGNPVNGPAPG